MKLRLGFLNKGINIGSVGVQNGGATSTPAPTVSEAVASGTTLFADDFSEADGTEINGKAVDTDYLGYGWIAATGQFDVQSGKLRCITNDRICFYNLPTPNFTITVTITPEDANANAAVAFRYSDKKNFWYARWRHASNAIQIIEVANNVTTVRATAALTETVGGETYTIVITANGTTITATVNSVTATYNSATFNQYVANCGVYGLTGMTVDNLTVTAVANESLPIAPNFSASNATVALTTPTYDGSGDAIHPDVVDAGATWNGYRYWMAMTPYPLDNSALENPSILVSNDKATWVVPDGLTNPVIAAPGAPQYNSDADLCFSADGTTLYMVYRVVNGSTSDIIFATSTTDGIAWDTPVQILSGTFPSMLSPSLLYDGTQYVMYFVDATTVGQTAPYRFRVMRTTSASPTTGWATPHACGVYVPARDAWHLNVVKGSQDYVMLLTVAAVNSGTGNPSYMHIATSLNGLTWRAGTQVLGPSASGWDNNAIYRASCLQLSATSFDLFYSARNSSAAWGTGRVTMTRA